MEFHSIRGYLNVNSIRRYRVSVVTNRVSLFIGRIYKDFLGFNAAKMKGCTFFYEDDGIFNTNRF